MNPKNFLPVVAGAIAGAIVAVAISSGSGGTTKTITNVISSGSAPSASSVPTSISKGTGMTINQIYRQDSPGVVDITVTSQTSTGGGLGLFGGGGGTQETEGEGAGVVYNAKGDILTDEHVVANATSVTVHFQDGLNAKATVVGADASTDVAVIHVNVPSSQLHPLPFADSSDAEVGDSVVAIGSPFSLPETTTAGIVSAVGRSITAPNNYTITGAIQTDAAINPGNSGGPLIDAEGQVLGLNDQIETNADQSAGVGFATPGNTDEQIANDMIAGKKIRHSYVGVELTANSENGAAIQQVEPNSPASNAGLEPGDLITAVNGKSINSTEAFISVVASYAPGQTITLTLTRSGHMKHISLTLGTRPATSPTG